MGFKFIKELGEKLQDAGISSKEDMAGSLADAVRELKLDIDKLDVSYDDGKATIRGLAADDDTRERVILAVGNHFGVSEVEDELTVGTTEKEQEEADAKRKAAVERSRKMRSAAMGRRLEAARETKEELEEDDDTQEGVTSVFYTVKSGDTLSAIAAAHYDDGSKYPVIFEANQPMLKDPNLIYPGQVLRIPPLD